MPTSFAKRSTGQLECDARSSDRQIPGEVKRLVEQPVANAVFLPRPQPGGSIHILRTSLLPMKPNPSIRATARWAQAIDGLPMIPMARRPVAGMWSIAEYTDCVRETTFGTRFLLDISISGGDVDLGECSCRFAASDESRKDVGKGDRSACCAEQATKITPIGKCAEEGIRLFVPNGCSPACAERYKLLDNKKS